MWTDYALVAAGVTESSLNTYNPTMGLQPDLEQIINKTTRESSHICLANIAYFKLQYQSEIVY